MCVTFYTLRYMISCINIKLLISFQFHTLLTLMSEHKRKYFENVLCFFFPYSGTQWGLNRLFWSPFISIIWTKPVYFIFFNVIVCSTEERMLNRFVKT